MRLPIHLTLDEHLLTMCPRCGQAHEGGFHDEFDTVFHYSTRTCDCGYCIFIRSHTMSSGHGFLPSGHGF
ncbi:MAG: hypothetical protein ABIH41_05905 [Nanoarchaeota archaeon]